MKKFAQTLLGLVVVFGTSMAKADSQTTVLSFDEATAQIKNYLGSGFVGNYNCKIKVTYASNQILVQYSDQNRNQIEKKLYDFADHPVIKTITFDANGNEDLFISTIDSENATAYGSALTIRHFGSKVFVNLPRRGDSGVSCESISR